MMRRFLSVWLPRWPIDRLRRRHRQTLPQADGNRAAGRPDPITDPNRPVGLVTATTGGQRLTIVNRAGARAGLHPGQLVTDAKAIQPDLYVREAEPRADAQDLKSLGAWCARYTPWVAPASGINGLDGLMLEITGCAHLFGGEETMLCDLLHRLETFGFEARGAIADTQGTAWALARYGCEAHMCLPTGQEARALGSLPVAALRLDPETVDALMSLGLKTVSHLMTMPRAPLAKRFGPVPLTRLDQALGALDEPLSPLAPPAAYRARIVMAEPLSEISHLVKATARLARDLTGALQDDAQGARSLALDMFRLDGAVHRLDVGTARPVADPRHIVRLFTEKLDRLGGEIDTGYGIEVMTLSALVSEPLVSGQLGMDSAFGIKPGESGGTPVTRAVLEEALAPLTDRIANRLGLDKVRNLQRRDSHIPERAVSASPVMESLCGPNSWQMAHDPDYEISLGARPIALLPRAEPIDVIAEIPEGPPRQFRWRRSTYRVTRAEGPERLAPEWWRLDTDPERMRDYYRIEDENGRRFWLYRHGLYTRDPETPEWYMHGFFA